MNSIIEAQQEFDHWQLQVRLQALREASAKVFPRGKKRAKLWERVIKFTSSTKPNSNEN